MILIESVMNSAYNLHRTMKDLKAIRDGRYGVLKSATQEQIDDVKADASLAISEALTLLKQINTIDDLILVKQEEDKG